MEMKIVIAVNKRDVWFCRLCVASIRYYYPNIEIWIIKDYFNGKFSTKEIEKYFNVKVLDLGIKKYGWAVSKMHVLLAEQLKGERIFILDSDTIFIGKFLETLYSESEGTDFTVNAEFIDNCKEDWVKQTYNDIEYFKAITPDFEFPGYFFNTGQMIITSGVIDEVEISNFFSLKKTPFWKDRSSLPTVDQSLLNYFLPYKEQKSELKIYKAKFMIWSESREAQEIGLEDIISGREMRGLIHWAGALRVPHLKSMTRSDLLIYFEDYYYTFIPYGLIKKPFIRLKEMAIAFSKATYLRFKFLKNINLSMAINISSS